MLDLCGVSRTDKEQANPELFMEGNLIWYWLFQVHFFPWMLIVPYGVFWYIFSQRDNLSR